MTLRSRVGLCVSVFLYLVEPRAADFYRVESGKEPGHLLPKSGERLGHDPDIDNDRSITITIARFVEVAAFEPGISLTIYEDFPKTAAAKYNGWQNVPDDQKRYAIVGKLGIGIDEEELKFKRSDRTISRELAVAIQRVWAKALHLTRPPSHHYLGMDGSTYVFSVSVQGLGFIEGQTWSPTKGLPRELVDTSILLIRVAEQKAPPDVTEEILIRRLRQLEAKIPKPEKS